MLGSSADVNLQVVLLEEGPKAVHNGVNLELAIQALLVGFQVNRGQS